MIFDVCIFLIISLLSLNVKSQQTNNSFNITIKSDGSYNILVDNKTWLQSANTFMRHNNLSLAFFSLSQKTILSRNNTLDKNCNCFFSDYKEELIFLKNILVFFWFWSPLAKNDPKHGSCSRFFFDPKVTLTSPKLLRVTTSCITYKVLKISPYPSERNRIFCQFSVNSQSAIR